MNKWEDPGGTGGRQWDVNKTKMYTYMDFSKTNQNIIFKKTTCLEG